MARYQKLSDELIVPNLDQDISFFYDPATKKLRKRFEIYPQALDETVKFSQRPRTNGNGIAQTNPSRTPTKSLTKQSRIISRPLLMEVNQRCLKAWPYASHLRFAQHDTAV